MSSNASSPSTNNVVTTVRRPVWVPSSAEMPAVSAACFTTLATAWRRTRPPGWVGKNQADRLPAVGDLGPPGRRLPLLVLHLPGAPEQRDDRRHQPMLTLGALGLRRPELLAPTIHVDRRPQHERGPRVEVDVLPCQAQHLGYPPTLEEQQCHGRTEAMIPCGGEQRPDLVT